MCKKKKKKKKGEKKGKKRRKECVPSMCMYMNIRAYKIVSTYIFKKEEKESVQILKGKHF